MRTLQLFWTFARVGALNELQYRANLVIQLVESAINVVHRATHREGLRVATCVDVDRDLTRGVRTVRVSAQCKGADRDDFRAGGQKLDRKLPAFPYRLVNF